MRLDGKKVAILVAPRGTEDSEFRDPRSAILDAGGHITVIGIETGSAQTVVSDLDPKNTYEVDMTFDSADPDNFDGLIVPGGTVGSDKLRVDANAIKFVKAFIRSGKPVAVICHGPWLLVEADAVKGRRLTSYSSLRTDIRNAGGDWVDEEVVVDDGVITSRSPDDLPAFIDRFLKELVS